jgi:hypothetical protein
VLHCGITGEMDDCGLIWCSVVVGMVASEARPFVAPPTAYGCSCPSLSTFDAGPIKKCSYCSVCVHRHMKDLMN